MLALAGGTAGILAKSCVAPLERLRILAQTSSQTRGFAETAQQVARQEGLTGFWRGNATNCLRVFPNKAVLFAANDLCKRGFVVFRGGDQDHRKLPPGFLFLAGACSGLVATAITYPLDMLRTRLTGTLGNQGGLVSVVQGVVAGDGLRGLYRGMAPTLFGALAYEGIKFGCYDLIKQQLAAEQQKGGRSLVSGSDYKTMNIGWKLGCSAVAGSIAGLVLFPNDTVRKLMQMQGGGGVKIKYHGAIDCYRTVLREEGMRRFFRGLGPYLLRIVPNSVIQFQAYEMLKQMLL